MKVRDLKQELEGYDDDEEVIYFVGYEIAGSQKLRNGEICVSIIKRPDESMKIKTKHP